MGAASHVRAYLPRIRHLSPRGTIYEGGAPPGPNRRVSHSRFASCGTPAPRSGASLVVTCATWQVMAEGPSGERPPYDPAVKRPRETA